MRQELKQPTNSKGARAGYKHLLETNLFGVRDRIKAERKNPRNRYNGRKRRRH